MSSVCLYLVLTCSPSNGDGTPTTDYARVEVVRDGVPPKQRLTELGLSASPGLVWNGDKLFFFGAEVNAVRPGSPAARAGLRPRDVITWVDDQPLGPKYLEADVHLGEALRGWGKSARLFVFRGGEYGKEETLTINLP
jgi:hypothetical protein